MAHAWHAHCLPDSNASAPMNGIRIRWIRLVAAWLVLSAGALQAASPWYRPLDGETLVIAATGVVYLIVAVGLFGLSRFTLFVAVALCLARSVWLPVDASLQVLLTVTDFSAALACLLVLWTVRNEPSR